MNSSDLSGNLDPARDRVPSRLNRRLALATRAFADFRTTVTIAGVSMTPDGPPMEFRPITPPIAESRPLGGPWGQPELKSQVEARIARRNRRRRLARDLKRFRAR